MRTVGPGSTRDVTLGPGEVARVGTRQPYRRLAPGPGAERVLRDELSTGGRADRASRSLAYLVHLTDLQLADVQSPGRFEFLEAYRGEPGAAPLVPAQRAQEALCAHGVAEMVREVGRHLESRDTGASLDLAVSTGDSIDNAQWNELEWYLALLSGGEVPLGGGREYEGVQRADWPGTLYWKPDEADGRFQRELGYPTLPGLLREAVAPIRSGGLPVGWVSCFGNHEALPFGVAVPTEPYRELVTGDRKATGLPSGLDPLGHLEDLYRAPERFLGGPARAVAADPRRRIVGRREFVAAHLAAAGTPAGHGYSRGNLDRGTAYAAVDLGPLVRLLLLDTTNLDGDSKGSLGARQMRWLEEQLVRSHSWHRTPDGRRARTGHADRLVVLASHHGLASLTNLRRLPSGLEEDQPRLGGDEVRALLHRFPNVVMWLNGHRHVNEVAVRASPARDGSAFVDVATCSIADWPSQARLVELVANADGTLSVLAEMLDHGAPAVPAGGADGVERLASLHRELAANVPCGGFGSMVEGTPADRNVEVVLRQPFRLVPEP